MSRIDVVPTVDVLSVDREAHAGHELDDTLNDAQHGEVSGFRCTFIVDVGIGQNRDVHGDGTIIVVETNQ